MAPPTLRGVDVGSNPAMPQGAHDAVIRNANGKARRARSREGPAGPLGCDGALVGCTGTVRPVHHPDYQIGSWAGPAVHIGGRAPGYAGVRLPIGGQGRDAQAGPREVHLGRAKQRWKYGSSRGLITVGQWTGPPKPITPPTTLAHAVRRTAAGERWRVRAS